MRPSTILKPHCHSQTLPTRSAIPWTALLWRQAAGPLPVSVLSYSTLRPCSWGWLWLLPELVLPRGWKPLAIHQNAMADHSQLLIRPKPAAWAAETESSQLIERRGTRPGWLVRRVLLLPAPAIEAA